MRYGHKNDERHTCAAKLYGHEYKELRTYKDMVH